MRRIRPSRPSQCQPNNGASGRAHEPRTFMVGRAGGSTYLQSPSANSGLNPRGTSVATVLCDRRSPMIEGFRVDVTAEELVAHLDGRVQHHRERTQECEAKLRQLQAVEPGPHDEEEMFDMCASSRLQGLERMAGRHRS